MTSDNTSNNLSQDAVFQNIVRNLKQIVAEILHSSEEAIDPTAPFLEIGADSLVLIEAIRKVEKNYSINVSVRQFFEELQNINALALYIYESAPTLGNNNGRDREQSLSKPEAQTLPEESYIQPQHNAPIAIASTDNTEDLQGVERIIKHQIDLMSQQLGLLQSKLTKTEENTSRKDKNTNLRYQTQEQSPKRPKAPKEALFSVFGIFDTEKKLLSEIQQQYIDNVINRFVQKTAKSKKLAEKYRPVLADNRMSAGFRYSTKEMVYPIFGDRAKGSRFWDVDGNEYIDLAMGFGVNLFGHSPDFVMDAVAQHLPKGIALGPQTELAGEVAELIHEITGVERVAFTNSGTEAVMLALRLARTFTRKKKIALFTGSYHGHFDGLLALPEDKDDPQGVPAVLGVNPSMVEDILVLDYGSDESISIIKEHSQDLAGILVEPVQSRRPNLQPQGFLQNLRQIASELGIPLIFDEMITGFRIHPGGAQAWFGVSADIVTYGKILGGGFPIGCVGGKAELLDGVDGGMWHFGDKSYPMSSTTFFAGTFCKHPLAMVAAKAVLLRLREIGPELQLTLNRRTEYLKLTLNEFFENERVPIRIVNFGSLFRFAFSINLDLLFYQLVEQGIYIWEGRNCMLSTAHSDADIEKIIDAVKIITLDLKRNGFLLVDDDHANKVSSTVTLVTIENEPSVNTHSRNLDTKSSVMGDLTRYMDALSELNEIAVGHIIQVLERADIEFIAGNKIKRSQTVLPSLTTEYSQLWHHLFVILEKAGWLTRDRGEWIVQRSFDCCVWEESLSKFQSQHLIAKAEFDLTVTCGKYLWNVITGNKHPLEILFGIDSENHQLASDLYHKSFGNQFFAHSVANTITRHCAQIGSQRKVKILEVGAGTGGTTLPVLEGIDSNKTQYWFTDVSKGFVSKARKNFGQFPQVQYSIFDVELDPDSQELAGNSFDIIIASNVLHSTRSLAQSLQNLKTLLSPNGILIVVEATSQQNWLDITFGLTEGWWRFEDRSLRPDYPLISLHQWRQLILDCGMEVVNYYPRAPFSENVPTQHMIVVKATEKNGDILSLPKSSEAKVVITDSEGMDSNVKQYPLTPSQEQLWILNNIGDGSGGMLAYNLTVSLHLDGNLILEILREAIQEVVNRHEALRTIIDKDGKYQLVLPEYQIELPVTDLSALSSEQQKENIAEWFRINGHRTFNLVVEPLFRVHIIKLGDYNHLFIMTTHHIVSDGWSLTVIADEISHIYSSLCQGKDWHLEQPMQFIEYAEWLRKEAEKPKMQLHKEYWVNKLGGNIPILDLPKDFVRPPLKSFTGDRVTTKIPADVRERIKALGIANNCTLFMTLLPMFTALLHRLSKQEELVVSIPTVARSVLGSENLVGFAANQLPILSQICKDTLFTEHLMKTRRVLLEAYDHQDYPYAEIINNLLVRRDLSVSPLAAAIFNLNPQPKNPYLYGLQVSWFSEHVFFVGDEISLHITDLNDQLVLDCDYNTELFKRDSIIRMLENFKTLILSILNNPEAPLAKLQIIGEQELNQMVTVWNDTAREYDADRSVQADFEEIALQYPRSIALVYEDQEITFQELDLRANQLANYLLSLGNCTDGLIGIFVDRSIEMVIGILAVLKAGAAYVPLDTSNPSERTNNILTKSGIRLVLTSEKYREYFPSNREYQLIEIDQNDLWIDSSQSTPAIDFSIAKLAYVIFTSGSTGLPKGVMVEHRQVRNFFSGMDDLIPISKEDVWLAVTTISFDISVLEILWTLGRGVKVVIQGDKDSFFSSGSAPSRVTSL